MPASNQCGCLVPLHRGARGVTEVYAGYVCTKAVSAAGRLFFPHCRFDSCHTSW